jgi:L-malate glycosyltransferase
MPVRVLHLDSGREWRGGQRQLLLLADGQRTAGLEPLVAAPPQSALVARCRSRGVAVAAVRMRSRLDLFAVRRIHTLIRTWRPDIVHAHDPRALALARAALLVHPNVPLVVTRRGAEPPRRSASYVRGVGRVIAISATVVDALRTAGVPRDRIRLVYPGVATPMVERPRDWRAECQWEPTTTVIGIIPTSPAALAAVAAAVPGLPADARRALRLVLLGGPAAGMDSLAGVPCFRAGHVHEVQSALAGLDALVQPVVGDGLGTAVIEALALGVPVVVPQAGSLAEIVETGRGGILVPVGDSSALSAALGALISDAALRMRLGASGPERAQRFDVPQMVRGVAAVYEELRRTSAAREGTSQ